VVTGPFDCYHCSRWYTREGFHSNAACIRRDGAPLQMLCKRCDYMAFRGGGYSELASRMRALTVRGISPNDLTRGQYTRLIEDARARSGDGTVQCEDCHGAVWGGHGLDRRDNSVGYTLHNVRVVCGFCNRTRGSTDYSVWVHQVPALRELIACNPHHWLTVPRLIGFPAEPPDVSRYEVPDPRAHATLFSHFGVVA